MWINSFIVLSWLVSVCSNFFFSPSWPWGEKTQKMYSFNLMPVWGVSPASSDQWKVNSLHSWPPSAVLIFLQLLLPFALRLVSFSPRDWSDCHRLDKLAAHGGAAGFCGIPHAALVYKACFCTERKVPFWVRGTSHWEKGLEGGKTGKEAFFGYPKSLQTVLNQVMKLFWKVGDKLACGKMPCALSVSKWLDVGSLWVSLYDPLAAMLSQAYLLFMLFCLVWFGLWVWFLLKANCYLEFEI